MNLASAQRAAARRYRASEICLAPSAASAPTRSTVPAKSMLMSWPSVALVEGVNMGSSSRLEEPMFTPSTKATEGHDINIDFAGTVDRVGAEAALGAKQISLALYRRAAARCAEARFILADTKFELGYV